MESATGGNLKAALHRIANDGGERVSLVAKLRAPSDATLDLKWAHRKKLRPSSLASVTIASPRAGRNSHRHVDRRLCGGTRDVRPIAGDLPDAPAVIAFDGSEFASLDRATYIQLHALRKKVKDGPCTSRIRAFFSSTLASSRGRISATPRPMRPAASS
jgi:hypothetical protein